MNNKGQISVGAIIMVFVAIVAALAMYSGGIVQNIGSVTNTNAVANASATFPANQSTITLQGQAATSVVVINATSNATIPSSNYTILNYQVVNGALVSQLKGLDSIYNGSSVKVSYTSEPFGYDTNSGGRVILQLVAVFAALAIVVVALWPVVGSKILESFS